MQVSHDKVGIIIGMKVVDLETLYTQITVDASRLVQMLLERQLWSAVGSGWPSLAPRKC